MSALRFRLFALPSLLDWRPLLLAALALLGLLAIFQLPLRYSFQIGIDRGVNTDRPFLGGFRDPELTTWDQSWRWTQPEATVTVPGVGRRPLLVALEVVSHRQHWQADAPQPVLTVDMGTGTPARIPLRYEISRYELYVPEAAVDDGTLRLRLSVEGWQNPADPRGELGVAIGRQLTITSAPSGGVVWPGSGLLAAYPAALALLWLATRALGFGPRASLAIGLALLGTLLALTLVAPPRIAVSSWWALEMALLALGTTAACMLLLPPLLTRWGVLPGPSTLPWLLLLVGLTFVLKYGGQLHPVSMPGDVQLHINRFSLTIWGQVYIPAQHRGLPFPFPNGWYILLAPLSLLPIPLSVIFELTAGLAEATSVLLYYLLLARLTGSERGGLLGAALYAISPIPMMNVWWSFQTQVGTQFLTLALLCLMILRWPRYTGATQGGPTGSGGVPAVGWITLLLILVFLGHIGAFINVGLVGLAAIPWLWLRARTPEERAGARQLMWAGLVAAAFALTCYYSGFAGMILDQVGGVVRDGMLGVTEREPVARAAWLRALWAEGLVGLNGGFLVLFGVAGALLISWTPRYRASIVGPLIWLTFAVGLSQALLPLITRSTITTRWLTFAGWALTVGSTVAILRYQRRGRAGKIVTWLAMAYVAWITLEVWALAMAVNRPPLEPF